MTVGGCRHGAPRNTKGRPGGAACRAWVEASRGTMPVRLAIGEVIDGTDNTQPDATDERSGIVEDIHGVGRAVCRHGAPVY